MTHEKILRDDGARGESEPAMDPQNPYVSPAATSHSPAPAPRMLRTAGLTICLFLGTISALVGLFIATAVIEGATSLNNPVTSDAMAAITLYLGFGAAWLLAGMLFLRNHRVGGWVAVAVGVAIPIVLFSIFGV